MSNHVNAENIFRNGSQTFYNSTRFFPKLIRAQITDLYAFVRIADYYVDSSPQKPLEFALLKANLKLARTGIESTDSIVNTFVSLEAEAGFDPAWADAFLASMELDLHKKSYQTYEETKDYCYGSAAVIGLFVTCLIGADKAAYPYAEALGNAFQLINFIRDIQEDQEILGRQYIPTEEMRSFGLSNLNEVTTRAHPKAFHDLIALQIKRYQTEQAIGIQGLHYLPRRVQTAIKTAADMYDWTGKQILKDPFIIYKLQVKPSKTRILSTGLRHMLFLAFIQKDKQAVFTK